MNYASLLNAIDGGEMNIGDDPEALARKMRPVEQDQMQVILGGGPAVNRVTGTPTPIVTKLPDAPPERDVTRAVSGRDSDFDMLGAIAAFTRNPVLAEQVRMRNEAPEKRARLQLEQDRAARDAAREARAGQDFDFDFEQKKASAPFKMQEMKDAQDSRKFKLDEQRAEMDPTSPYSQAMRNGVATQLNGFASTLAQRGAPEAQVYAKAAQDIQSNPGLTVTQMLGAVKPLSDAAGFNLKALHDQATEANAKAQLNQGWAHINVSRENAQASREERKDAREDRALASAASAAEKKADKIPGDGGAEKYAERKVAQGQVTRALELLPSVRYTGGGAETMNWLASKAPDSVDPRNAAEKEFVGILNGLRAKARNKIFGAALSKYDTKDAESFLASLGTNPETIRNNLTTLQKSLDDEQGTAKTLYPGLAKLDGQSRQPTQKGANKSSKYEVGQVLVSKDGRKIRWSGSKWDEVK